MTSLEIFLTILSAAASVCAIVFGAKAFRRGQKQDDKEESERLTRIESNVEHIKTTVDDIKSDQHDQSASIAALFERVTRVEESARQAHKRIDMLNKTA